MLTNGHPQVRPGQGAHGRGLQRLCTATGMVLNPDGPAGSDYGETIGGYPGDGRDGPVEIERRLPITRWE